MTNKESVDFAWERARYKAQEADRAYWDALADTLREDARLHEGLEGEELEWRVKEMMEDFK